MELTTIYLILSLIANLIFFLLYRKQKEKENLQEQIIERQEKLIKLLERMDELEKETN